MKYIVLLCLFSFSSLFAQETKEFFIEAIAHAKSDSSRHQSTIKLCKFLYQQDLDSARYYAKKGIETIANKKARWAQKGKADLMNILAVTYYFEHDFKKAEKHFRKIANYNRQISYESGEADALSNLAAMFGEQNLIDSCIVYDLKALGIRERIKSSKVAISYNNLGLSYKDLRMYDQALVYYKKAIDYKSTDKSMKATLGNTYLNVANVYKLEKMPDSSYLYYQLALDAAVLQGDSIFIGQVLNNIGSLYADVGNYEAATKNLEEAYKILLAVDSLSFIVPTLSDLARVKILTKSYAEATKLLDLATKVLKSRGLELSYEMEFVFSLYENIAWSIGDVEKAKDYEDRSRETMDALHFKELRDKSHQILLELDNERKETQIVRLEKERKIQDLENEKLSYQRGLFISASVLLILIVALLFWMNRWKAKVNKQLKVLNDTKDKLFSIVAHDLKNPLSAFRSITQSLSEDIFEIDKEDLQYFINRLNDSAGNLLELLQNLLYWAIAQSGRLEYNPIELVLQENCQKTIDLLANNIEEKQLIVNNNIRPEIRALGDAKMTDTILRNLLANAIKFTAAGGTITVDALKRGDNWVVSIKDNGIGISKELQKTIFAINSQESQRNEVEGKGTGLGLILCKELTERQGGRISVESELGQGTTFFFTIAIK